MAIAPSKLGNFVLLQFTAEEDAALVQSLRAAGLVSPDVSDAALRAVFERARHEHAALGEGVRQFNSPHERVRAFLEPFLTAKGQRWAVPLRSLHPWRRWLFWR